MASISIIGAGWLGKPLAHHLTTHHSVYLSKSSQEQTALLRSEGWQAYQFQIGETLPEALATNDIAVINIPPKLRGAATEQDAQRFISNMRRLFDDFLSAAQTKRLVFISTTAVYGDTQGEILETTPVAPTTLSAKAHVELETYLLTHYPGQTTALRLSGLVNVERHPVRSLVKRRLASDVPLSLPQQVVNLIHRVDVIAAIERIIEQEQYGHTLHLACPDHPTRKAYYCWAARQCELPEPTFATVPAADRERVSGKCINASYTLKLLNLRLRAPSPYDMFSVEQ